jgi:hypothetical protein
MGLFGDTPRPKGITEEELLFVKSELRNGDHKLTENQTEQLLARLAGYMDSDSLKHPEWKQMGASEVDNFDGELEKDTILHLTQDQKDKVEKILEKYVDISKHKSLF